MSRIEAAPMPRKASAAWMDALAETASIESNPTRTLVSLVLDRAASTPDAPALLSDGECYDYAGLAARMKHYAGWAKAAGVERGGVVALLMGNRPEYIAIWLGVAMAGGVTALLNANLTGGSLSHCLAVSGAKHLIIESDFVDSVEKLPESALKDVGIWCHGPSPARYPRADQPVELSSPETALNVNDTVLLIYTSGTTGLPKAARVSHRRVINWSLWFRGLLGASAQDRMYDCLPLYHSVGGVVAVGSALAAGGSVVIASKFSASRFWDDVANWNCTLFQYIGELCRYLLNAPPHSREASHSLRIACGNGLRGDIWEKFRQRFHIPQIMEFYAATEGNFSLYNAEGEPGAIGRIPPFLKHRFPVAIVKHDIKAKGPYRNADGRCVRVGPGEAGEAIGCIDEGARFEGYTRNEESESKILRDVFEKGDAWYRTGDLMRVDARGFYYFVDRIGDTFRWKGENVSTNEVAQVLSQCDGVSEAIVYGVEVPGAEGRAGMALLITRENFSLGGFREYARKRLPPYAVPVFLRIGESVQTTGTFKYQKDQLVREGFDPGLMADVPFFGDPATDEFIVVDEQTHRRIYSGQMRL